MDHYLDKAQEDMLLNALEAAKDYTRKSQENREKQLWRKVDIPCTLLDTLNGLTKSDMDEIRKKLDLKNLSALKKSELAIELSGLLPGRYGQLLHRLDQGKYGLLREIARRGGFVKGDMSLSRVEALVGYGLAFPCVYKDQRGLFIPQELVGVFMQADGTELQNTVARNTEWELLTQGMLYYYGVMDILAVQGKIEEFTSQKVDLLEYLRVIDVAIDSYGLIRKTRFGFMDDRVFDAKKVMEEHLSRPDVDYFPFSKKQLLEAGNVGFIDKTPAMNDFISFLTRYYELKEDHIDEIAYQMIYMINSDAKPELMLQYLQSWFEFPSLEFTNQLMTAMTTLHNYTRLWVLKGHTPDELFQKEKKFLRPLPPERFPMEKPVPSVVDSISSIKTGRNDPCPCGSGKKYKKCCGRG